MDITYEIKNQQETCELAKKLAHALNGNEVLILNGDLGAGKTTFAKALIKELGVDETVTSPTFAFMKEYYGKYKISHYDMYRAEDEDELFELGISDNLASDGICVIEWNKFRVFPDNKKIIVIDIVKAGETARNITVNGELSL